MSRPLLDLCLLDDNLLNAWLKVKANDGAPGEDGVTIDRFADGIITRLAKLREQVVLGTYKPSPLLRVALPRPGKSPRLLGIPTVRDRVLQSAVASVLQIHLELEFEDESFGYRPGRSVASAIERVIALRQQGFVWLLDADVTKFFDKVDHALLLDKLQVCLPDNSCSSLIEQWIKSSVRTPDCYVKPEAGLPQGSPISPLLANLYLDGFDETISSYEQFRLVRYADDFLILTKTQADAERALTIAENWLSANGLSIQSEKTSITSFEKGFSFLGVSFLGENQWATDPQAALWVLPPAFRPISEVTQSKIKPTVKSRASKTKADAAVEFLKNRSQIENAQRESETMNLPHQEEGTLVEDYEAPPLFRSIYLTEPGIYINKVGGRIKLNRGEEQLLDVPLEKIDQIIVTNEGAISFGALRALTDSQCSLVVHGLPGAPLVTLQDAKQTQVELQHAQHLLIHNHERRISAARQIVKGKIKNQRLVLQRYFRVRGGLSKEVDIAMRNAVESANHADTLDELRGHEGIAARAYFGAIGVLLESSGFKFAGRQKRLAADPINALLSYCYGVLFQNILTLIHRRGLCPYTGCLHSLRQGHAALVSDLMEEFRPIVADSCVLRLIMQGRCKPSHFDPDEAFIKIPLELRKLLIQTLEDKLDQRLQAGTAEKPIDLRRRMQMQVNQWVDYLRGDALTYTPYNPR